MKKLILLLILCLQTYLITAQPIDLTHEYSMEQFQYGIRAYHDCEYEIAINYFIKSLKYDEENHLARFFLGDSYRKAGYEKNTIFVWNNLLALGYEDRSLKNKLAYLYNKRGLLSEININKNFILKEDIRGYYDETKLPLFIKPSQIFVDDNNHYYIASYLTGTVVELDPNYEVVKNHFPILTEIERPFGIAVDKQDNIYISDFKNDIVIRINRFGTNETKIGYKGIGKGGLLGPEYLLIDNDENLYVVDSGNVRINKYRTNGDFLFSFGDNEEYRFKKPAGMFFYNDTIYICDRDKNEVAVFDKYGNFLDAFGDDKLDKPYDITRDRYNRFLIICEKEIWAYEDENRIWYKIDAPGNRLKRGISIETDREHNLLVTDFNTSRLMVFSHERERYTNLNVSIERIFARKHPAVHVAAVIEKDDFTIPTGITSRNVTVFENGKMVNVVGTAYTKDRDQNTDIMIIYDRNDNIKEYKDDIILTLDTWFKNKGKDTNLSFVTVTGEDVVIDHTFNATRLAVQSTVKKDEYGSYTDKGNAIKFGIYHMLKRFSKKAIIIMTNAHETGKDFDRFKLENCIALAKNNNIPIYVVSYNNGSLKDLYTYLAEKTGGEYYQAYERSDLKDLIASIEKTRGKEVIFSYNSRARSRFGEDPVSVTIQIDYAGMTGITKSIYYPQQNSLE